MDNIKLENLSIGQMAKLNHTTEQTLRLYDQMGIIKPRVVNKQTGYRYYTIQQCAHLDMVQYMKSMGMSLLEIKEQLDKGDVRVIQQVLRHHIAELEEQIRNTQEMKQPIERAITNYDRYLSAPPDGTITTEFIPGRTIYRYDINFNTYDYDTTAFEYMLQELKHHMKVKNLPINYYCNVGNIVRRQHLLENKLYSDELFIFVSENFVNDNLETIPPGLYACIYCEGYTNEYEYANRLFKHINNTGLDIVGDYLCEVIAELPVFKENERNTYVKLQIPIKYQSL